MKKEKMLRAMDFVDEKYVAEADPRAIKKKNRRIRAGVIAACACFVLVAVNLWLFLPFHFSPPDVSAYADSEYYEIIQKLNEVTYRKPVDKNNYEKYFGDLFLPKYESVTDGNDGALDAMPEFAPGASQSYEEVTDNQVSGVIEGDRIKRSDKYAFYLDGAILRAYSIAGRESEEVGTCYLLKTEYNGVNPQVWEFYLSEDCNTITVVEEYYDDNYVKLLSVDVSDPANMRILKAVTVSGRYVSSRVVDGTILLLTNFYVGMNPDFSNESDFLPQIYAGEKTESIWPEQIVVPGEMSSSSYTVVTQWEETTLAAKGNMAFLSYSDEVYVSQDMVYVGRTYTKEQSYTEISGLSYGEEGMECKGTVTVAGYLKDQYSMDEYENILRVVTTTNGSGKGTSASLYCVDLRDWEVVAEVTNFAPFGETVRSVRFDGDSAYVCTAVQLTDPVFFFDLSDLNNITYKDTGTIEGFSTSLVNMGNGYLLGIGQGDGWDTVKIEVYKESETGVVSVSSYSYEAASYAQTYKAYYIDREQQLVGLGVTSYSSDGLEASERYVLLNFDGTALQEVINVPLHGANVCKRAFLAGDYFYMFGDDDFKVVKIF